MLDYNELTRRELLRLTGGAGVAGLAGCTGGGGGGGQGSGPITTTSAPSETTLSVWTWTQDFFVKPQQWFEQDHGVTVEVQRFPWSEYVSKVVSGLSAGQSPDVLTSSVLWIPKFGYRDTVLPLDEHGFSADDYVGAATANSSFREGTDDATLYAIPGYVDNRMVGINKEKFRQAGLEVPSRTHVPSWDEFRMWAEELNKEFRYGVSFEGGEGFDNFLLANGGNWLADDGSEAIINNKAGVETTRFLKGLIDDDLVRLRLPGADTDQVQDFMSGTAPMAAYIGSWDMSRINEALGGPDTWQYVPMPKGPSADSSHSWSAGVFQMAPRKGQTAWALKWLEFLHSKRMQLHLMDFGGFPGRADIYETEEFNQFLEENPNAATIKQEMGNTVSFPDHTLAGEMYNMVHTEIQRVWEGQGQPQPVLDDIASKLEDLLQRGNPKP